METSVNQIKINMDRWKGMSFNKIIVHNGCEINYFYYVTYYD